jgi:hypothetical protein
MISKACFRQSEVKELLNHGHWPHACPAELHAHLADCPSCAEFLLVTQAFMQSRAVTASQVILPGAGTIWWRAQLRRRNAAVERMGKPILGAYVFALAFIVVVAAVAGISQLHHGSNWFDQMSQIADRFQTASPIAASNPGGALTLLIPIFATLALLGAVFFFFAGERK